MGRKAKWLNEGSDDIRGFVKNDDLKELFYDPTKNKLDQFEQLMSVLGIKYNKSVYDVFVKIFKLAKNSLHGANRHHPFILCIVNGGVAHHRKYRTRFTRIVRHRLIKAFAVKFRLGHGPGKRP